MTKNLVKIVNSSEMHDGIRILNVDYKDRFAIESPGLRQQVNDEISNVLIPRIEEYEQQQGDNYNIRDTNAITENFFAQSDVINRWRKTMPTAAALYPLQKPENKQLADGTPFDDAAMRYFPHALDGEGLRSRAAIMSWVMHNHFSQNRYLHVKMKWSSLASGAAIPVFDAAKHLIGEGKDIKIYLADIDASALKFAKKIADEEYDLTNELTTEKRNILRLDRLVRSIGHETQDAIDILGFFEYLPAESWKYRKYKVKISMPGAVAFLKCAYSLLKPGGLLVLGNMRDSHSQLQFTTKVVQWPYIRPRSIDRVTEIITMAGIDKKNITYYLAGDGVYTVAAIEK